jgi:hypothetical protein
MIYNTIICYFCLYDLKWWLLHIGGMHLLLVLSKADLTPNMSIYIANDYEHIVVVLGITFNM